eukprot:1393799-Amorphochlora_amoeboformis.AAC.1
MLMSRYRYCKQSESTDMMEIAGDLWRSLEISGDRWRSLEILNKLTGQYWERLHAIGEEDELTQ